MEAGAEAEDRMTKGDIWKQVGSIVPGEHVVVGPGCCSADVHNEDDPKGYRGGTRPAGISSHSR